MPSPRKNARTYHGSPCAYGHGTLKYESTRTCIVCAKLAAIAVRERRRNANEAEMLADVIGDLSKFLPKETDCE